MKMTARLISFLLLLCTLAWGEASLVIKDSVTNFGILPIKSLATRKLVFYSTGSDILRINEIKTTCPCIRIPLERNEISPGDSLLVELEYDSEMNVGRKDRYPYIYTNARTAPYRIVIKTVTINQMQDLMPLSVIPFRIVAANPKDNNAFRFSFELINKSDKPIPVRILYTDDDLFDIKLPDTIPALSTVAGELVLTAEGFKSEFSKSFTFEYIGQENQKVSHTMPVMRKIYRKD